jgi:hypothetical protein
MRPPRAIRGKELVEVYRVDRFGSVDGIVPHSSEDARRGLREVLMRVRASSLNYRDLMVLKGGGRGPTKLGVVPISGGAGTTVPDWHARLVCSQCGSRRWVWL